MTGKSLRIPVLFLCLVLWLPAILWAQIPRSSISFAYAGLIDRESSIPRASLSILENRITSYLLEVGRRENYSILPLENRRDFAQSFPFGENALAFFESHQDILPPRIRGVIIGEVNVLSSRLYVDIHIYSLSSGELLLAHSADFSNIEEGIDGSRAMVFGLFGFEDQDDSRGGIAAGVQSQAGSAQQWQRPSMAYLAGTWQGDTGLGSVSIASDGTGRADLSGNDRMNIRVSIDGELVRVRQDEPNAPKLYLSLFPYSIASQIVDLARPMSWEFRLTSDGAQLIGEKFTSYFYIENGEISRVDNTYSRPAIWTRMD